MGGLTSKYFEEMMHTPPRSNTHVLKSDPRSPSDNITRTPISVTDTPDRNSSGTPSTKAKKLPFDPRSPSTEVVRTPILVEAKDSPRRPQPLKPSRLLDLQTVDSSDDDLDPRSPTSRVPRTPLRDQTHTFTNKEEERVNQLDEVKEEEKDPNEEVEEEEEKDDANSPSNDENKVPLEISQKVLCGGNKRSNNTSRNPQSMLQAKQCQAIEAEYNKNQKVIFNQLVEEEEEKSPVPSDTQFVETI